MPRTMLQVRLQALERHIQEAQDPSKWKDTLALERFVVDDKLWNIAIENIHDEAMAQHDAIKKLMRDLAEGKTKESLAWRRYTRIQADSEQIFRECRELLGGLALRDRINEEQVCHFADELIKELATAVGRMSRFTIPVLDQSLSSTLRRVATVQFPEWNIWTLPLVAYEYAQVVIDELRRLRELVGQLAEAAAPAPARRRRRSRTAPTATDGDTQAARANRQNKMRILLADAVATYTTGPAYACAALILRLNPFAAATSNQPSDEDRAAVILGVLGAMSQGKPPPFAEIATKLGEYWKESVAAARKKDGNEPTVDLTPPIHLDEVIEALKRSFFRPGIAYTGEDWLAAQQWSGAWIQEIQDNKRALTLPKSIGADRSLRDALNACWHCRVATAEGFTPSQAGAAQKLVERISDVGWSLCKAIIERPPPSEGSAPATAPQPTGR
jgi:hypothetical protein